MVRTMNREQRGFSMVEVLVGMAIIGLVAVGTLVGLQSASVHLIKTDGKETAKNIAETQMEYVKGTSWQASYSPITPTPVPPDYGHFTAAINVGTLSSRDNNIQKITITVTGPGGPYVLEDYKVNTAIMGR
jgi:prepilin-type N-terminal cleavage/methylation domain-containing protein